LDAINLLKIDMNIFYLSHDPRLCAQYHADVHASKMILETAQLLSTAHRETDSIYSDLVYKSTHRNHPSAIWARASQDNYSWLFELFRELTNEFFYRREKVHLSWTKMKGVLCYNPDLPTIGFTEPPQCMDTIYKVEGDSVQAYRNYYLGDKVDIATWNWRRPAPYWWESSSSVVSVEA
jgi:hypothetical protein